MNAVAGEALERALWRDQRAHRGVVPAQHAHHLLGIRGLGKLRETAQSRNRQQPPGGGS